MKRKEEGLPQAELVECNALNPIQGFRPSAPAFFGYIGVHRHHFWVLGFSAMILVEMMKHNIVTQRHEARIEAQVQHM